jgi:hypothetical protein
MLTACLESSAGQRLTVLSVNFVYFLAKLLSETADKTNTSYINQSWVIPEHYFKKMWEKYEGNEAAKRKQSA